MRREEGTWWSADGRDHGMDVLLPSAIPVAREIPDGS
jgi:hypothetical protein